MCSFLDWCYIIYMHCLTKRVLIGVKICEKIFWWGGTEGGGGVAGVWSATGQLGWSEAGKLDLERGREFGFIARRWGHAPTLRICCKSRQGELNLERGRAVAGLECGGDSWVWREAYHLVLSRGGGGTPPPYVFVAFYRTFWRAV